MCVKCVISVAQILSKAVDGLNKHNRERSTRHALRREMESEKQNKKEKAKEREKKKERKNKNNHNKITIRRPTESGYDPNDKEVRPATETNQPNKDTKKEKEPKKGINNIHKPNHQHVFLRAF